MARNLLNPLVTEQTIDQPVPVIPNVLRLELTQEMTRLLDCPIPVLYLFTLQMIRLTFA
jgi:hypothetical protein